MFVAVNDAGAFGPVKLSCADELTPIFFILFLLYAFKSPATIQAFVPTLVIVADEYNALNVAPGVA